MTAASRSQLLLAAVIGAALHAHAIAAEIDAESLFTGLDANKDGQVVAGEVPAEQRLLFKRLVRTGDADGDKKLTPEEFAAALQPVRAEKPLVEKQGSRLPGADALAVLIAKMDVNGDQRIEAGEAPPTYERVYEQLLGPADGDKDGHLDSREISRAAPRLSAISQIAARRLGIDVAAELADIPEEQAIAMDQMDAYARPIDAMADPAQAEQLFKRLDANGDKHLVAEEAPGPFADRFAEMVERGDADGDKRLSRKEFLAMSRRLAEFESTRPDAKAVKQAQRQLLKRFDENQDGKLSIREAPPRLVENFDRADADANGLIEGAELRRVAETMARVQKFVGGRALGRPGMESNESSNPPAKKSAKKNRKARSAP
jgi:hypothetical protein